MRRGGMRRFALPLVRPLSTAHGTIRSRDGLLLSLMDEEGRCGLGEATPLPDFGTEELSVAERALERTLGALVDGQPHRLDDALAISARICSDAPCALSAVDGALHDLAAQRSEQTLARWIRARAGMSGAPSDRIAVQALVVGDDPADVAESARAAVAKGFETFKLKLAVSPSRPDLGFDLERVAALRESIGSALRIRLDANEAWREAEAESALAALEGFGIDYVEQPVARDDRAALARLAEKGAIAVAADEALLGEGWRACLEARVASVFIIKPAALGGIEPSLSIFRRASEIGIRVVWSSLIDGAVGRATAVALAAGLSGDRAGGDEVHGLGTANLLSTDFILRNEVVEGRIELGKGVGRGCDLAPIWSVADSNNDTARGEAWIVEATR